MTGFLCVGAKQYRHAVRSVRLGGVAPAPSDRRDGRRQCNNSEAYEY